MLNLIMNMGNSILRAGAHPNYPCLLPIAMADVGPSFLSTRDHRYAFILLDFYCSKCLFRFAPRHESCRILHGDILLVVLSPSQIGRSVSLSQMQGSALQIIHRNHESLFWVQWARCCFFPNAFGGAYLCVMTLYAQMFFFHVRDVRVWDHHRCVCVVFVYHSQTDICSKGIRFRFMFPDLPSVPVLYSLPTVDSSSRSPRSASPAHYHCTATSTNPPSSPSSRSAGYLSPTCIPNPKRRSI